MKEKINWKRVGIISSIAGLLIIALGIFVYNVISTKTVQDVTSEPKEEQTFLTIKDIKDKALVSFYGDDRLYIVDTVTGEKTAYTPEGYVANSNYIYYQQKWPEYIPLKKEDNAYLFNTITKEVTKIEGLKLLKGETIYEELDMEILSKDADKIMLVVNKFDKNSEEYKNEFAGPLPSSKKRYEYDIASKTVVQSTLAEEAKKLLPKDIQGMIYFTNWDAKESILMGHLSGEGIGNSEPVYIVDMKNKKVLTVGSFDSNSTVEKSGPSISPSMQKIVLANNKDITVYEYKDGAVSKLNSFKNTTGNNEFGSYGTYWSDDEKTVAIATSNNIYTMALSNGVISKVMIDNDVDQSLSTWDYNYVAFNADGSRLYFVNMSDNQNELKEVDLSTKTVRTIITSKDLTPISIR